MRAGMDDTMTQQKVTPAPQPTVPVWDLFVRIGHWTLVIAFTVAYLTEDEALEIHEWAGYVVAAYVLARIVWGFVGSKHARFADFMFSPVKAATYLVALLRGQAARYLGHSPAGAMMVFALLLALSGTVGTGMAELAYTHGEGPFSLILDRQVAVSSLESPPAEDGEGGAGRREPSVMREAHELFANLALLLIALHIAGVVVASISHKESLVLSMITGRKRPDGPAH